MTVHAWQLEQLLKVRRHQPDMVDAAVEDMLERQDDLRWAVVVGAYLDEEISLAKAADLLGMHRLVLQDRFIAQGIPLRIGPNSVAEARAEMVAIESWNTATREAGKS